MIGLLGARSPLRQPRAWGVRAVINKIEVDSPTRTDDEIAAYVRDALLYNPVTEKFEIDVSVEDGVAELTGTVDTWNDYQQATRLAWRGGAEMVDNDLMVVTGPEQ